MHPEKANLDALEGILKLIDDHRDTIVCVGEVGLDYSRHLIGNTGEPGAERAKEVQREVFRRQARRAEVGLYSRSLREAIGVFVFRSLPADDSAKKPRLVSGALDLRLRGTMATHLADREGTPHLMILPSQVTDPLIIVKDGA